MKKLLLLITALAMAASMAACGDKTAEKPADKPADKPATSTDKPAEKPAEKPTEEKMEITLDYEAIAEWVTGGFIGNDASGAPVVMGLDDANENAVLIFGENTNMTAVSFVGPITYEGDDATITDDVNESTLTFGAKKVDADTIELDMGNVGTATIKAADKDTVLKTIKTAIDNYKHLA